MNSEHHLQAKNRLGHGVAEINTDSFRGPVQVLLARGVVHVNAPVGHAALKG